jgi:competence protein ComEA
MGRRIADSDTAAIATERLALLLADLRPRRALPDTGVEPDQDDTPDKAEGEDDDGDVDGASVKSVAGPEGSSASARAARAAEPILTKAAERLPLRAQSFGRRHLGVLTVVLVIGLAVAGWGLLRARPVAVATPLSVATSAAGEASGAGASASGTSEPDRATPAASTVPTILVHVVGAVHRPGVVTLPQRARVKDAIDAAGGLTSRARPGELNLAQVVQDGQQIVVGGTRDPGGEVRDGSTGPGAGTAGDTGAGSPSSGDPPGAVVDLNTATLAQLDTLPGVGPVTAERILAWRTEHRRFSRVEELQEVDGIGPKTYAQIAPHVRV